MQDTTQRQIDYLAEQLTALEARVIDPADFGRMQGEVTSLRRDLDRLLKIQEDQNAMLKAIGEQLQQAKGGWRLMMALGGAAAALGGVVSWLATHTITFGPKA